MIRLPGPEDVPQRAAVPVVPQTNIGVSNEHLPMVREPAPGPMSAEGIDLLLDGFEEDAVFPRFRHAHIGPERRHFNHQPEPVAQPNDAMRGELESLRADFAAFRREAKQSAGRKSGGRFEVIRNPQTGLTDEVRGPDGFRVRTIRDETLAVQSLEILEPKEGRT